MRLPMAIHESSSHCPPVLSTDHADPLLDRCRARGLAPRRRRELSPSRRREKGFVLVVQALHGFHDTRSVKNRSASRPARRSRRASEQVAVALRVQWAALESPVLLLAPVNIALTTAARSTRCTCRQRSRSAVSRQPTWMIRLSPRPWRTSRREIEINNNLAHRMLCEQCHRISCEAVPSFAG
jgi:hypothetical protein